MFNNDHQRWYLWISDAEKAFLQGQQDTTERQGLPLFMAPPKDPIIQAAQAYPAALYEVTSNCYGLPNAPRVWFNKVDRDAKAQGFRQHSFDKCLYYHVNHLGVLDALMIIHVDDVMAVYSESFELKLLEDMLKWGSITKVSTTNPGEYRGKEITMYEKDGKFYYKVTQKSFTEKLTSGTIKPQRKRQPPQLSDDEKKEFRSICGCLQWLGSQTRPELSGLHSQTVVRIPPSKTCRPCMKA